LSGDIVEAVLGYLVAGSGDQGECIQGVGEAEGDGFAPFLRGRRDRLGLGDRLVSSRESDREMIVAHAVRFGIPGPGEEDPPGVNHSGRNAGRPLGSGSPVWAFGRFKRAHVANFDDPILRRLEMDRVRAPGDIHPLFIDGEFKDVEIPPVESYILAFLYPDFGLPSDLRGLNVKADRQGILAALSRGKIISMSKDRGKEG
jgi:hypothetical protein